MVAASFGMFAAQNGDNLKHVLLDLSEKFNISFIAGSFDSMCSCIASWTVLIKERNHQNLCEPEDICVVREATRLFCTS